MGESIMFLPDLNLNDIEEYKNFNLKDIVKNEYDLKIGGDFREIKKSNLSDKFHIIHLINGVPDVSTLPGFIEIESLDLVDVKSYNPFVNINREYQNVIYNLIFKVSSDLPVLVVNNYTDAGSFIPSNIRYTLKDGVEINLLESTNSDMNILANSNREFNISNATLNYTRVDEISSGASLIYNYYGVIDGGILNAVGFNNSGYININNWDISLIREGTGCFICGIVILKEQMRQGNICKINHIDGGTKSSQEFSHILDGESYAMYDGDSTILKNTRDAVISQKSKTIMLSDNARILNKPRLNIYTGEVKATHGATVGSLNPDDIFYFKQRGFHDNVIKEMLINAFVTDLIDRVESEAIREYLYDKR